MSQFPTPTTEPTPENIRHAAECVEFLVRVRRYGYQYDSDIETMRETNWDTLVASMKAWADALEPAPRSACSCGQL